MLLTGGNAFAVKSEIISTKALLCLDVDDQRNLAEFKLNCDVREMDYVKCRSTWDACINDGDAPDYWWAEPKIVIGGLIISAGVGAALVAILK